MAESKLSLIQKGNLCEIIHNLPVIFDKSYKGVGRNSKLPRVDK